MKAHKHKTDVLNPECNNPSCFKTVGCTCRIALLRQFRILACQTISLDNFQQACTVMEEILHASCWLQEGRCMRGIDDGSKVKGEHLRIDTAVAGTYISFVQQTQRQC